MPGSDPLVSIVINNYNYAKYVGQAVESAFNQDYRHTEIIVVDDGSQDDSIAILRRFGDKIRLIEKANGGQASAFNAGFEASAGEIICLLDADDVFTSGKVRRVVEIYSGNPDIGWCFDEVHEVRSEALSSPDSWPVPPPEGETVAGRLWDARHLIAAGKALHVPTATSGLSFRRAFLSRILPMPEVIRITSDNYIKFAALGWSAGWLVSEPLTLQRIHDSNAYTHRAAGRLELFSRTSVSTGIALYEKSEDFGALAIGMVGRSLGTLWLLGGVTPEMKNSVGGFLKGLGALRACKLLLGSAFYGMRSYAGQFVRRSRH